MDEDEYLNLFFSYDKGSYKSLYQLKQLENNVTRSFLVTLKNLNPTIQSKFLEKLLYGKRNYSDLKFDLQNFDKKKDLPSNLKKYLLTIGSKKSHFIKDDFDIARDKTYDFEKDEKSKEKLKKELGNVINEVFSLIENDY